MGTPRKVDFGDKPILHFPPTPCLRPAPQMPVPEDVKNIPSNESLCLKDDEGGVHHELVSLPLIFFSDSPMELECVHKGTCSDKGSVWPPAIPEAGDGFLPIKQMRRNGMHASSPEIQSHIGKRKILRRKRHYSARHIGKACLRPWAT